MNKTLKGFLVVGAAGATAFGGYVALSRLRHPSEEAEKVGPQVKTEIVREQPPVPLTLPKTEIIREESSGEI